MEMIFAGVKSSSYDLEDFPRVYISELEWVWKDTTRFMFDWQHVSKAPSRAIQRTRASPGQGRNGQTEVVKWIRDLF